MDYSALYHAYADGFEKQFSIQPDGTLLWDVDSTPGWYDGQRQFIHLLVVAQPPVLALACWTPSEVILAYTHALVAYERVCEVMGREKLAGYAADVRLGGLM